MKTTNDILEMIENYGMSLPYDDTSINYQMHYLAYMMIWRGGQSYV